MSSLFHQLQSAQPPVRLSRSGHGATRTRRVEAPLGVKEYYFTGGEPFLNPDMVPILEATLRYGPRDRAGPTAPCCRRAGWSGCDGRRMLRSTAWSFAFLWTASVPRTMIRCVARGPSSAFCTASVELRCRHGFLPIITVTRTHDDQEDAALFAGFVELLRAHGYARPRLKLLPTLRIGAEACNGNAAIAPGEPRHRGDAGKLPIPPGCCASTAALSPIAACASVRS